MASSSPKKALPLLPGYHIKTTIPRSFEKSHRFDIQNGVPVTDAIEARELDRPVQRGIVFPKVKAPPVEDVWHKRLPVHNPKEVPMSQLPSWIAYDNKVLRFSCYFKEPVHENPIENYRVRACELYYYLEDDSIHVQEVKDHNSGIKQGLLIRRHQVPKDDDSYYSVHDLVIGAEIELYGKVFKIYDADAFTKKFFSEKLGTELGESGTLPLDPFHENRIARTRVRSSFSKTASEVTKFSECQLGKPMRSQLARARQFLKHDRQVLRFWAIWRDPALYGEIRPFIVHFFRADGTMEVLEVKQPNSGRDSFPALLARQKLPRSFVASNQAQIGHDESDDVEFFTEQDFRIGHTIHVYTRELLITDADDYTRRFYADVYGVAESDMKPVLLEDEDPAILGFGGHGEQSTAESGDAGVASSAADASKGEITDNMQLRFEAMLNSSRPEDEDRRFIVTFFLSDSSISIFEKKVRNSGFIGGKFLERTRLQNPDNNNEWFMPQEFFVGAEMRLNRYPLKLIDADEFTLRYMEGHCDLFPTADVDAIARKLATLLKKRNIAIRKTFRLFDADHDNTIDLDEFIELVKMYGWNLTEQECLILFRKFDKHNRGCVEFNEFAEEISKAAIE